MKYVRLLVNLVIIIWVTGCISTVTPKAVESSVIAFDGNNQNAGFVGWSGEYGVITFNSRNKYNHLINIYATNFIPVLTYDYGISPFTNNTFLITREGLSRFGTMNRWSKLK